MLRDPSEERPAPRHRNASDTETAAAELIAPRAGTLRLQALKALSRSRGRGLTDHELAERTGAWLYSIAPRRNELVKDGWVEDSGRRRSTSFHSNSTAIVWVLTEAGRAQLKKKDR